jgi:hypothetical protein
LPTGSRGATPSFLIPATAASGEYVGDGLELNSSGLLLSVFSRNQNQIFIVSCDINSHLRNPSRTEFEKHLMQPSPSDSFEKNRQQEMAICDALKKSGYRALRRLVCEFDGRVFTLQGRVSTYYEKQIAQEIVLARIGGRICFDNQLEVVASPSSSSFEEPGATIPTLAENIVFVT